MFYNECYHNINQTFRLWILIWYKEYKAAVSHKCKWSGIYQRIEYLSYASWAQCVEIVGSCCSLQDTTGTSTFCLQALETGHSIFFTSGKEDRSDDKEDGKE